MKINLLGRANNSRNEGNDDWIARAVAFSLILVTTIGGALALWRLADLLPIVFVTILLAIGWRASAEFLSRRTSAPMGLSLLLVGGGLVVSIYFFSSLFGRQLLAQYDEVALDIPAAIALLQRSIEEHPWGHFLERLMSIDFSQAAAPVANKFTDAIGAVGSLLGMGIFVIIGSAYLAADPDSASAGVLALTPASRRDAMTHFLSRSGATLRKWLVIQLYVVVMNTVFAAVLLWLFSVPAPMAIATTSGLLAFIPYFGSMVALLIAALVALPHGVGVATLAAVAVGGASFVEGYLITPYLQGRSLMVPPAILLLFMLAFATLFGTMGVALAVPATVIVLVAWSVFVKNEMSVE
ncbi:AI-2E family transporter [Methylocystis parvus]|uniref:AI-2E family transporter n=1 Tax=Methylocystis parvus TaxID=134 RepID=UPI003C745203